MNSFSVQLRLCGDTVETVTMSEFVTTIIRRVSGGRDGGFRLALSVSVIESFVGWVAVSRRRYAMRWVVANRSW